MFKLFLLSLLFFNLTSFTSDVDNGGYEKKYSITNFLNQLSLKKKIAGAIGFSFGSLLLYVMLSKKDASIENVEGEWEDPIPKNDLIKIIEKDITEWGDQRAIILNEFKKRQRELEDLCNSPIVEDLADEHFSYNVKNPGPLIYYCDEAEYLAINDIENENSWGVYITESMLATLLKKFRYYSYEGVFLRALCNLSFERTQDAEKAFDIVFKIILQNAGHILDKIIESNNIVFFSEKPKYAPLEHVFKLFFSDEELINSRDLFSVLSVRFYFTQEKFNTRTTNQFGLTINNFDFHEFESLFENLTENILIPVLKYISNYDSEGLYNFYYIDCMSDNTKQQILQALCHTLRANQLCECQKCRRDHGGNENEIEILDDVEHIDQEEIECDERFFQFFLEHIGFDFKRCDFKILLQPLIYCPEQLKLFLNYVETQILKEADGVDLKILLGILTNNFKSFQDGDQPLCNIQWCDSDTKKDFVLLSPSVISVEKQKDYAFLDYYFEKYVKHYLLERKINKMLEHKIDQEQITDVKNANELAWLFDYVEKNYPHQLIDLFFEQEALAGEKTLKIRSGIDLQIISKELAEKIESYQNSCVAFSKLSDTSSTEDLNKIARDIPLPLFLKLTAENITTFLKHCCTVLGGKILTQENTIIAKMFNFASVNHEAIEFVKSFCKEMIDKNLSEIAFLVSQCKDFSFDPLLSGKEGNDLLALCHSLNQLKNLDKIGKNSEIEKQIFDYKIINDIKVDNFDWFDLFMMNEEYVANNLCLENMLKLYFWYGGKQDILFEYISRTIHNINKPYHCTNLDDISWYFIEQLKIYKKQCKSNKSILPEVFLEQVKRSENYPKNIHNYVGQKEFDQGVEYVYVNRNRENRNKKLLKVVYLLMLESYKQDKNISQTYVKFIRNLNFENFWILKEYVVNQDIKSIFDAFEEQRLEIIISDISSITDEKISDIYAAFRRYPVRLSDTDAVFYAKNIIYIPKNILINLSRKKSKLQEQKLFETIVENFIKSIPEESGDAGFRRNMVELLKICLENEYMYIGLSNAILACSDNMLEITDFKTLADIVCKNSLIYGGVQELFCRFPWKRFLEKFSPVQNASCEKLSSSYHCYAEIVFQYMLHKSRNNPYALVPLFDTFHPDLQQTILKNFLTLYSQEQNAKDRETCKAILTYCEFMPAIPNNLEDIRREPEFLKISLKRIELYFSFQDDVDSLINILKGRLIPFCDQLLLQDLEKYGFLTKYQTMFDVYKNLRAYRQRKYNDKNIQFPVEVISKNLSLPLLLLITREEVKEVCEYQTEQIVKKLPDPNIWSLFQGCEGAIQEFFDEFDSDCFPDSKVCEFNGAEKKLRSLFSNLIEDCDLEFYLNFKLKSPKDDFHDYLYTFFSGSISNYDTIRSRFTGLKDFNIFIFTGDWWRPGDKGGIEIRGTENLSEAQKKQLIRYYKVWYPDNNVEISNWCINSTQKTQHILFLAELFLSFAADLHTNQEKLKSLCCALEKFYCQDIKSIFRFTGNSFDDYRAEYKKARITNGDSAHLVSYTKLFLLVDHLKALSKISGFPKKIIHQTMFFALLQNKIMPIYKDVEVYERKRKEDRSLVYRFESNFIVAKKLLKKLPDTLLSIMKEEPVDIISLYTLKAKKINSITAHYDDDEKAAFNDTFFNAVLKVQHELAEKQYDPAVCEGTKKVIQAAGKYLKQENVDVSMFETKT